MPSTEKGWLDMEKQFKESWNFPHCLSSLDGKHVVLQAPINSGSEYFNYKNSFSIVIFALVDANYNFIYVGIGCQGRISDGGVFKNSTLYSKIQKNELRFPKPEPLNNREKEIPYFFIGDDAFALSENLIKVFPGIHPKGSRERIFNYRLSRARRVVENAFGISSSIFRVLRKPLLLEPQKVQLIVKAIVHLHNFLRRNPTSLNMYSPPGSMDAIVNGEIINGSWRNEDYDKRTSLLPLKNIPRKSGLAGKEIREELADYFIKEGQINWQNEYS